MFLRSLKSFLATVTTVLLLAACGGESAPPPAAITVVPGESSATVSWDMTDGVEYWVFAVPTSSAPSEVKAMEKWIGLLGGVTLLKATSPTVVPGLVNGTNYSFSVNARTNGGPGGSGATPVTATPAIAGVNWTAGTSLAAGNDLHSVAYGAITSTTTINSVTTTTTTSTIYVAGGSNGAMYSSSDAANWSVVNYATTARLNGAAYLGNFKLVGDGGLVLTSTDAVTWTAQTSGTSQNLYAIASNSVNLNVAVGANGTIILSGDGVTWTKASNSGTSSDLYAVAYNSYNSGTWVAVGAGGTIVESADGSTWHTVTSGTLADLHGIASSTVANTVTSATGVVSLTGTYTTTFVAVGGSGIVLTSADAASWTPQTLTSADTLNAVTYGTQFVTVGAGGKIFYSTNGSTWLAATSSNTNDLYAVAHGQYLYSAVGAAGTNLWSR